jgi:hypothetical protein
MALSIEDRPYLSHAVEPDRASRTSGHFMFAYPLAPFEHSFISQSSVWEVSFQEVSNNH